MYIPVLVAFTVTHKSHAHVQHLWLRNIRSESQVRYWIVLISTSKFRAWITKILALIVWENWAHQFGHLSKQRRRFNEPDSRKLNPSIPVFAMRDAGGEILQFCKLQTEAQRPIRAAMSKLKLSSHSTGHGRSSLPFLIYLFHQLSAFDNPIEKPRVKYIAPKIGTDICRSG